MLPKESCTNMRQSPEAYLFHERQQVQFPPGTAKDIFLFYRTRVSFSWLSYVGVP